jgi:hypothetical protein
MTSARVRFYKDPVQSLCTPLRDSELKLLGFLEDHMRDGSACYRYLRYFRLTDMCPYCQGLAAYTLLRFEGLAGRHVRRLESASTPTFVEIPRSFEATRFILRSLTEADIKYLDAGSRSTSIGEHHASSGRTKAPPHGSAVKETRSPYQITYRQSVERHGSTRCRNDDVYYRDEDIDLSFRRLVVTTIRDRWI